MKDSADKSHRIRDNEYTLIELIVIFNVIKGGDINLTEYNRKFEYFKKTFGFIAI